MRIRKTVVLGCCAGLLAMSASAVEICFQQGNLSVDGSGVSGAYQTHATFIRSSAPQTTNDGSTGLFVGTTRPDDFRRLLLGFDLTFLKEKTVTNACILRDVELKLTVMVDGRGAGKSTFDLHQTEAFDESTATWENPGDAQVSGGVIGDKLGSAGLDMSAVSGTVISFKSKALQEAVQDALNTESGMLYLMLKRRAEGGEGAYYLQPQNDEASTLGITARPALVVNVLIQP